MKILFDGDIYSRTSFGGMVRYYNQLINGLTARGIDIDLLIHEGARSPTGTDFPRCRLVKNVNADDIYDIFHGSYYSDFSVISESKIVVTVHDMIDELLPQKLTKFGSSPDCIDAK